MTATRLTSKIRRTKHDDIPAIHRMLRTTWKAAYPHIYTPAEIDGLFSAKLHQRTTWSGRRCESLGRFVAVVDSCIVGVVSMARLKDGDGEITQLYVDPAYHGCGVGYDLWQYALQQLQSAGCARVWVWVLERAQAVQFYERQCAVYTESGSYCVGDHIEPARGYIVECITDEVNRTI